MGAKSKCPKGYGEVEFKETGQCPISGKTSCVICDVEHLPFGQTTKQVKRKSKD